MNLDSKAPSGPIEHAWEQARFDVKLVNPANKRKHNIILVGSGLAGASASSTLGVSFASTTTSVCTVSGTSLTLVSVGMCSVTATQAGNSTFAAAAPVTQSFMVSQGTQTITFGALNSVTLPSAAFALSATASSGLAVSFASTTPAVCTVSGSMATPLAAGTCTITASQAGNANYAAATPVME